ncbi:MAG: hypothetical protein R3A10_14635 [Caldilineaceae bacterium]
MSQSFVQDVDDIRAVRRPPPALDYHPFVIAKIECRRADNMDAIPAAVDGVMVACATWAWRSRWSWCWPPRSGPSGGQPGGQTGHHRHALLDS